MAERTIYQRGTDRFRYERRRLRTHRYLRRAFSSYGPDAAIFGAARFWVEGTATVGRHLVLLGEDAKVTIKVGPGATLTMGDHVCMNAGACIEAWHDVRVGSNVLMAPYVFVIDDDMHDLEPGAVRYKGPVIIGNNVWLGRNATVLPGATIGDGSAIGANSVVTGPIPPGTFAAGAPARVIRKLDLADGWVRRLPEDSLITSS
jgi:acetyltransferase-like isoleucine patch superfamily enzyme